MSDGERNQNPRQPRNLQGLLNFCTEITAREDTTQPTSIQQLDPERRRFLEEALNSLTVNVAKKLAVCVKTLCSESVTMVGEDVTEQEEAMEVIEEHVDDMNHAIDLYKMGAFPVLVRCLDSPHSSLRVGAAGLIGEVCQNNLMCQENMITLNIVPQLLHMIDGDEDAAVRVKALYALSRLIRDYPEGGKEFMKEDGFSYLMRAMQSGVEKLVVRSAVLLSRLIQENDLYKVELLSMGYVEQLSTILNNEETDKISREYCTGVLLALASSYPPALAECMRPELHLKHLLTERLKEIKAEQELQKEESYITELLKRMESPEADVHSSSGGGARDRPERARRGDEMYGRPHITIINYKPQSVHFYYPYFGHGGDCGRMVVRGQKRKLSGPLTSRRARRLEPVLEPEEQQPRCKEGK